jgi:flagellar hook-length control protein FliK
MSKIASESHTELNANLSQPPAKKGAGAEHALLFDALFGGVVARGAIADPDADGSDIASNFATSDFDAGSNLHEHADILASMQSVAAMMSVQRSKGQKSELSDVDDKFIGDESILTDDYKVDAEEFVSANPMVVGPMPDQQQTGTSLSAVHTSTVMAKMALEDEAPISHQNTSRTSLNTAVLGLHPSVGHSQMSALSSSALKSVKSDEKAQVNSDSVDALLMDDGDGENIQPRSDRRPAIRPAVYQSPLNQASTANSKTAVGSDVALVNKDENLETEYSDESIRVAAMQRERVIGRVNGQTASGESLSANAVRQMQAAGASFGGQMSQQNNGHSSSQSGGFVSASTSMTNGGVMDILDMAQDNWTEMLLQRVERGLAGGKDKIDFHLNPRNLGKMRISLIVQNDRTNIHIQTETVASAQMLSDAEARLAQMMDASGLKFGNLTSQYSQNFTGNFSGQNSGQGREGDASHAAAFNSEDETNKSNAEISVEGSDNLINLQA